MKIRFSSILAVACSIFMLAGCCSASKPVKKEMAIQLYSARDLIGSAEKYAESHEEVLKAIAEMGYTSVETANYKNGLFYGVTPEEFKADVEAAGMTVLSAHTNKKLSEKELESGDFSESLAWWDEAIKAHQAAGMEYIVIPSIGFQKTVKNLQTYCEYFNALGRKCKEAGISFGYHNHAYEFGKVEDSVVMYDYMLENTDPEFVFFQMDVYWVVMGKASPVDYFNKYPGRFKILHIKDRKEIGQSGMVGFDAIFNNAEIGGVEGYVVEVEGCRNEAALGGIRTSAEYLLSAPFVKKSNSK